MADEKVYKARPIGNADGFTSNVDIVIPFHGQYHYVIRLLSSLFRYTLSNPYTIYLVDDCSPNTEYIKDMRIFKDVVCIRNETQLGFGGAMKAGFEQTKSPWVVFMNSDCEVEDVNWLKNLGNSAINLKSKGVRMVFPRTNNSLVDDPELQFEKDRFEEDKVFEGEYIPMYCFMVHRKLFTHVNGFIKSYPFGGYEDTEFAYRLKKFGYKQGISGKSWVYHAGGVTCTEVNRRNPESVIEMEHNKLRCIEDMKLH